MPSLCPHPAYAEDQPYAKTILNVHVTQRSFQTGAFLGLTGSALSSLARRQTPAISSLLRSAGTGALIGLALGMPMTFGRMRGREEIEWQDRSWRLLENRGQVEVEAWSLLGSLAGGVAVVARGGPREREGRGGG